MSFMMYPAEYLAKCDKAANVVQTFLFLVAGAFLGVVVAAFDLAAGFLAGEALLSVDTAAVDFLARLAAARSASFP